MSETANSSPLSPTPSSSTYRRFFTLLLEEPSSWFALRFLRFRPVSDVLSITAVFLLYVLPQFWLFFDCVSTFVRSCFFPVFFFSSPPPSSFHFVGLFLYPLPGTYILYEDVRACCRRASPAITAQQQGASRQSCRETAYRQAFTARRALNENEYIEICPAYTYKNVQPLDHRVCCAKFCFSFIYKLNT